MASAPDPPYVSVSEAYDILAKHKFVMTSAIQELVNTCNLPDTAASTYKIRKLLVATLKHRAEASRRGKLAEWSPKVFCNIEVDSNDPAYVPSPP